MAREKKENDKERSETARQEAGAGTPRVGRAAKTRVLRRAHRGRGGVSVSHLYGKVNGLVSAPSF